MKIKEVIQYLETIAPTSYQESYDNAGLIVGNANWKLAGTLICLDSTEAVIEEAIEKNCNLVIAHHPIVFKGLKRFNGKNYIERTIIKAIKADIAIYAIHTNLDNVYKNGVNAKIAERLGLINTRILAPKKQLKKLFAFTPIDLSGIVKSALFKAGAGTVNQQSNTSYTTIGVGTTGKQGQAIAKLEVYFPAAAENKIITALEKVLPSKEITYDILPLENTLSTIGSGMIGVLPKAMNELAFLSFLKKAMHVSCIKHTSLLGKKIKTVAVCGGSGGFLLPRAIRQKADIFITADYKYHEFFDANEQLIIADIGHYESEQFTIELLYGLLTQKFRNFAAQITETNTNPVQYFF